LKNSASHWFLRITITLSTKFFSGLQLHQLVPNNWHTCQPEKILLKSLTMTASRHVSLITLNTAIHGIQHMAA
jgi:hypothetical protein